MPGFLFLAEALGEGLCYCFLCCCSEAVEPEVTDFKADFEYDEEKTKTALDEYKASIKESKKADELEEKTFLSIEEEIKKVMDTVSKREKTSILYISNITSLPKQRVIEIILKDPDYRIEHEYVLNKKLLSIEEKFSIEKCPKCGNHMKPDWLYCPNCSYVRK
jgi:hypothetical protein